VPDDKLCGEGLSLRPDSGFAPSARPEMTELAENRVSHSLPGTNKFAAAAHVANRFLLIFCGLLPHRVTRR